MPGHPDDDLLADLAADVLPADQARAVEAHVLACGRCAGLLEDAEHVRGLLLADDPGPVPADVWLRVEAALAAEGAPAPVVGRPADRVADTAAFQAFVDAPPSPVAAVPDLPDADDDEHRPGWSDDADPLDDPVRWSGGRGPRSAPASRGTTRRDTRTGGGRRRGPVLLAAAAAVGVVAVVGAVRVAGQDASGTATISAGGGARAEDSAGGMSGSAQAGPDAAGSAPIVSSGRAYRESTLADQAATLLDQATRLAGRTPEVPAAGTPGSATPRRTTRLVAPDPASDDVRNPAQLATCLAALGVPGDRLVAVDLATYEGREAAILLLAPAEGGGHEVWAVERSCSSGSEGALKYTRLSR